MKKIFKEQGEDKDDVIFIEERDSEPEPFCPVFLLLILGLPLPPWPGGKLLKIQGPTGGGYHLTDCLPPPKSTTNILQCMPAMYELWKKPAIIAQYTGVPRFRKEAHGMTLVYTAVVVVVYRVWQKSLMHYKCSFYDALDHFESYHNTAKESHAQ